MKNIVVKGVQRNLWIIYIFHNSVTVASLHLFLQEHEELESLNNITPPVMLEQNDYTHNSISNDLEVDIEVPDALQ